MTERCATSEAEAHYQQQYREAPEFSEDDKRSEAGLILSNMLADDVVETLDILSKNAEEFDSLLYRVSLLIKKDEHLINTLLTAVLDVYDNKIQESLEMENV